MFNIWTIGMEDIEDLILIDVDARNKKKYVLPRAIRHKTSKEQRTCADSIIPGIYIIYYICGH